MKQMHLRRGAVNGTAAGKSPRVNAAAGFPGTGINLASDEFMTRKRFKLGLAALCLLTAFFMALIGLLLAPTLASAEKNSGTGHPQEDGPNGNGTSNPIYWEHGDGHEPDKVGWNAPHAGPCADGSCGNPGDDTQSFQGGSSEDSDHSSNNHDENHGQDGHDGNGSPGFPDGRFAGGFGGGSGGPSGGGNPHDQPGTDHNGNGGPDDSGPDVGGPDIHQPNDPYHDPDQPPFDPGKPPSDPLPGNPPGLQNPAGNSLTEIPEPLSLSLFAIGLTGLAVKRRRSKAA
jgi:hypothetical protein